MLEWILMLMNKERWELHRIQNGSMILLNHTNNNIENSRSNIDALHLPIILSEHLLRHLLLALPLQISLIMLLSLHHLYTTSSQARRVRRLQIQIRHRGVTTIHIFIHILIRNHRIQGALRLLISSWMGDGRDLLLRLLPLVGAGGVGVNLDLLGLI